MSNEWDRWNISTNHLFLNKCVALLRLQYFTSLNNKHRRHIHIPLLSICDIALSVRYCTLSVTSHCECDITLVSVTETLNHSIIYWKLSQVNQACYLSFLHVQHSRTKCWYRRDPSLLHARWTVTRMWLLRDDAYRYCGPSYSLHTALFY